jgi:hypothetical protein
LHARLSTYIYFFFFHLRYAVERFALLMIMVKVPELVDLADRRKRTPLDRCSRATGVDGTSPEPRAERLATFLLPRVGSLHYR